MKSIFETLAALSTGAVLLSGCGASPAPVNATEVPAASEAKPSTPAAPAETAAAVHAAPTPSAAPSAAPTATPVASSTAKPAASAAPAAAPAKPKPKPAVSSGKKTDGSSSCGAGTCG